MTHDTSKDPRLLVAEIAVKKLKRSLFLKLGIRPKLAKDETHAHLKGITGELMTCKYMYLPPHELADQEPVGNIVGSAKALHDSISDIFDKKDANPTLKAEFHWCFRTLEGLSDRLGRGGETMASGVDLMVVKVRNVVKKDKLWITRVDTGQRELTVVTNLPGMGSAQVLAVAFLPPVELAGTMSEAMFLGPGLREEKVGTFLTDADVDVKEASSVLHKELIRN